MILQETFESEDFHHNCKVFPESGLPYKTEKGNVFVPEDWVFWFRHNPTVWDQPEARLCWDSADANRVRTGSGAYLYFGFFRRMDAGLFRQVDVEPGTKLRLTGWAHAWSNHLGRDEGGHPHDGRWSDGAGFDAVAWKAGTLPSDTGEPQKDAKPNFTFQVGIDPTGGTDPLSDTVVWGQGYHIYNGYCQELAAEATAEASTVTVFLRSKTLWKFNHNDAYWDDVRLIAADKEEPPAPPEGGYESTMLVLPQNATEEQLAEIMADGYAKRRTFGFSHDDAAYLNGTAILYNIPKEQQRSFLEWYAAHNPNVVVEWAYTSDWEERPSGWEKYHLSQHDYDGWFAGDCWTPSLGCYITCVAMAQRIYEINSEATPISVDNQLGADGYTGCLAKWTSIKKRCGIRVIDRGDLDNHLGAGRVAMLEVDFEKDTDRFEQHFVLAVDKVGDDYLILDPWGGIGMLRDHYNLHRSFRLLFPYSYTPSPPDPDPDIGDEKTSVSLHLQTMDAGWRGFMSRVKPRLAKVTASMQDVLGVLSASPETTVVYRHVHNNYGDTLEHPDPHQGARNWINKFRDSLVGIATEARQRHPDCEIVIESVNECVPSLNEGALRRLVDFDIAYIEELEKLGLPGVRAGVFNAAVGNPHESEYHLLVPLARACADGGHFMDYHTYWRGFPDGSRLVSEYKWYSGRWMEMDKVFRREGIHVKWYGGESGVYATAHDGWKSNACYKGDWELYFEDIKRVIAMEREWNEQYGNRKYENTLFTTGVGTGWANFQIRAAEMEAIARWLCQ